MFLINVCTFILQTIKGVDMLYSLSSLLLVSNDGGVISESLLLEPCKLLAVVFVKGFDAHCINPALALVSCLNIPAGFLVLCRGIPVNFLVDNDGTPFVVLVAG